MKEKIKKYIIIIKKYFKYFFIIIISLLLLSFFLTLFSFFKYSDLTQKVVNIDNIIVDKSENDTILTPVAHIQKTLLKTILLCSYFKD